METKLKINRCGKTQSVGVLIKDIPEMKPFLARAPYPDREIGLYVRVCICNDESPMVAMLGTGSSRCGNGWTGKTTKFFDIEYVNIDEIAVTVL